MKMKVSEAVLSQQSLQQIGSKGLPIQVSITIAQNLRSLNEVAEAFHERRNALIEKLGEKDEKTGQFTVKPDNIKAFGDGVGKLNAEEVEVKVKSITLKDLPAGFEVAPNHLVALHWMISMVGQTPTKPRRKKPH